MKTKLLIGALLCSSAALAAPGDYTVVGSQAALQSFPGAVMAAQNNIEVLNYYAGVPGGGNKYSWQPVWAGTPDGNIVVAPSDNPGSCSQGCMVSQLSPVQLNVLNFGAKVDNSTNDSTAANACTTYFSNIGGGTCRMVCSPAHIAPCVMKAEGIQYHSGVTIQCDGNATEDSSTNQVFTIQSIGSTRWVVNTDGTGDSVLNWGLIGCRIAGTGTGNVQGGLQIAGTGGYVTNNRFWLFGEEAILADNGSHTSRVYNNIVLAPLGNYFTNVSFGGIRHCGMNIQGQDHRIMNNEVSADYAGLQTLTGAGMFRTAICYTGSLSSVAISEGNVAEFADVGFVYDNTIEGGAYGDAGSNNYGTNIVATTNGRGNFFSLEFFSGNRGGTAHTCYVANANNCPLMAVDPGASGGSPGGGKNFYGAYIVGQNIAPSAGIVDSYVQANGGIPNTYDGATINIFGIFGLNLGFKGFTNQANGSIATATTGSPRIFNTPSGASNYCPDAVFDIGSVFFSNPGAAGTVTLHADAATCTLASGFDGMHLDIVLGGANVTINDSFGTSKTFNAAASNSHRATLVNVSGTEKWSWDF